LNDVRHGPGFTTVHVADAVATLPARSVPDAVIV
jgi:hypothetical protein